MFMPTADQIFVQFSEAAISLTYARAQQLAEEIAAHGGLDQAIAELGHDEAAAGLDDALAYRAFLAEGRQPQALISRLLRQARDLDARAEPAWADAGSLRGKAAYRCHQGEHHLAETLLVQARAAERFAAKLEEQAFGLRLQAAGLEAQAALRAALFDVAA